MSDEAFTIRAIGPSDTGWVAGWLREHWGDEVMVLRGEVYRPADHHGFVALVGDEAVGLATYLVEGDQCELLSLDSLHPRLGIGGALVEAVAAAARAAVCHRLFLVTTNDNLEALGFYQRRGFALCGLAPGAVERARSIKPSIPFVAANGIPIRDELTLERWL
jgi:GNAT superfamily N-acetyltransferase